MRKITGIPKGFTLVELLIVVALIAIMATFAVPAFQNYTVNSNTRTAAREIMADMLSTRQRAISENRNAYRLTFNTGTNSYALSRTDTGVTLWTKNLSSFGGRNVLQSVNFSGGSVISFQRRGTVTFGTIVIKNEINSTATITLQITGRAYVQYSMQK